jgi:hypothetical protein
MIKTIPTHTEPRTAAERAYEYTEYALMHPGQFSQAEQIALTVALHHLQEVAGAAREVC